MKEKYTHEEIARLAYELWDHRGRQLGSPEIDGTRRKVLWACGIREGSSRSRVSALSQRKVPIANLEFSLVVQQGFFSDSGLRRGRNA
jgi:hypothetical protein